MEKLREALKKSWPASILIAQYKLKDIVLGLSTVLSNYFEVLGPSMGTPKETP